MYLYIYNHGIYVFRWKKLLSICNLTKSEELLFVKFINIEHLEGASQHFTKKQPSEVPMRANENLES